MAEFPNEYDYDTTEEFESAKSTFINSVQAGERFKHQQTNANNAIQQQNDRAAFEQQEKFNSDSRIYAENAKKSGIGVDELTQAANAVLSYGATPDLVNAIIKAQNPLITKYLAANPHEVDQFRAINPWDAGSKFSEIAAKAATLKPKTRNTPSPTTDIQGNGASPAKHPALEGVTYS